MSTYLYLRCKSHNPPLDNDGESGQHLRDLDNIWDDIADRDTVTAAWRKGFRPNDTFRYNTAKFLVAHPHCDISVVDEYERIHYPDGTVHDDYPHIPVPDDSDDTTP